MPNVPYKYLKDDGELFYPVIGESSFGGALPVSKGGTGATTAEQARENLGLTAGGMTFDLLWTDSHFPNTIHQYSFAAQTIALALSNYKMVLIETWTQSQSLGHHILPVPTPSATNQLYNYLTDCFGKNYVRACVVNTTGIAFEAGGYYDESGVMQTDNYRVHPCRIWGIK